MSVFAAATADAEMEEAAAPTGAAAKGETMEERRVRFRWMRQQKEGAAAVD